MRPVAQAHALGCAVACVASRTGASYDRALSMFANPENAWLRGYYCPEIVAALSRAGLEYAFEKVDPSRPHAALERSGTIVFAAPSAWYPVGHYLIRSGKEWMNPWANYPRIIPVEAELQADLPGTAEYVIYEKKEP